MKPTPTFGPHTLVTRLGVVFSARSGLGSTLGCGGPGEGPDVVRALLTARIEQGLKKITDRGWQADTCLIQPDATTLQAQGIEVGLVAKLAGHSNPTVTLGHYTQAVRGGEAALAALETAYRN